MPAHILLFTYLFEVLNTGLKDLNILLSIDCLLYTSGVGVGTGVDVGVGVGVGVGVALWWVLFVVQWPVEDHLE